MIVRGDNLYRIAQNYGTTVDDILMLNSHLDLDPYNLRIGEIIDVCPRNGSTMPFTPYTNNNVKPNNSSLNGNTKTSNDLTNGSMSPNGGSMNGNNGTLLNGTVNKNNGVGNMNNMPTNNNGTTPTNNLGINTIVCQNPISYIIRRGDNLYQLSNTFGTSVQSILTINPHLDPYNLRVGDTIVICSNDTIQPVATPTTNNDTSMQQMELSNEMRTVWLEHVFWTRALVISIVDELGDTDAVSARLLQNPKDLAAIYSKYYGEDVANQIDQLITEHLTIGADLIKAVKNNDPSATELDRRWYENADKIATALSTINPYYDFNMLQSMLYTHLDQTKQEVALRIAKDYPNDIINFDAIERHVLEMADYLTQGIIKQFPDSFR